MREDIQDVKRMTKRYNTVDGEFLRRNQICMRKVLATRWSNYYNTINLGDA